MLKNTLEFKLSLQKNIGKTVKISNKGNYKIIDIFIIFQIEVFKRKIFYINYPSKNVSQTYYLDAYCCPWNESCKSKYF
jgi:hypothetical protein